MVLFLLIMPGPCQLLETTDRSACSARSSSPLSFVRSRSSASLRQRGSPPVCLHSRGIPAAFRPGDLLCIQFLKQKHLFVQEACPDSGGFQGKAALTLFPFRSTVPGEGSLTRRVSAFPHAFGKKPPLIKAAVFFRAKRSRFPQIRLRMNYSRIFTFLSSLCHIL